MAPVWALSPSSQKDKNYIHHMSNMIDKYHQVYDKFLLPRNFNAEDTEPCLSQFLFEHDPMNLVNEKKLFQKSK